MRAVVISLKLSSNAVNDRCQPFSKSLNCSLTIMIFHLHSVMSVLPTYFVADVASEAATVATFERSFSKLKLIKNYTKYHARKAAEQPGSVIDIARMFQKAWHLKSSRHFCAWEGSQEDLIFNFIRFGIYLFIKNICVCNAQLMQKAQQRRYKTVAAIWTKKFSIPSGNSKTRESVLLEPGAENSKPRARYRESPRAKCHSSCSWNKQFQSASRSQVLPTTSGRQQFAVLCKVGWTQTVLTFVDHGRQFEYDSLTNWKPMQISKNGSDMIVFPCVRDKSSSRILDML